MPRFENSPTNIPGSKRNKGAQENCRRNTAFAASQRSSFCSTFSRASSSPNFFPHPIVVCFSSLSCWTSSSSSSSAWSCCSTYSATGAPVPAPPSPAGSRAGTRYEKQTTVPNNKFKNPAFFAAQIFTFQPNCKIRDGALFPPRCCESTA